MSEEMDMDEVWGMYAEEGGRSLDDVEECLLILQDAPSNTDAVGRLFRALHTFKGNARILGLSVIESIAHLGEDMIGLVRDDGHELDSEIASLLMEATDMLRGMLETSASIRSDVDRSVVADLAARMKAKCDACRAEKTKDGALTGEEQKATQSIIFVPVDSDELGNDPVYREIFFGMVNEVLQEMCTVLKSDLLHEERQAKFAAEEERLHHAATQMGMHEWQQVLQGSIGAVHAAKEQMELQEMRLRVLFEQEMAGESKEDKAEVKECAPTENEEAFSPEPEGTQSLIFDPVDPNALGNDPVYREMFFGMAHDVLKEMGAALLSNDALSKCQATFREESDRLLHAADQMGMSAWHQALLDFQGVVNPSLDQLKKQEARLQKLYEQELGLIKSKSESVSAEIKHDDPVYVFFDALKKPLNKLSQLGNHLFEIDGASTDEIMTLAREISELAESYDFVRVADVLNKVITESKSGKEPLANNFSRLEFLLYEELASIVSSMQLDGATLAINPEAVLRSWCVDHVFETLLEMRNALERIRTKAEVQLQCERIVDYMRQVYYACLFYDLETAAHLSMSILDLFARAKAGEMTPDTVLLHIAKSYINDIELIFDAAGSGETPDMAKIEKLLMDASEASFAVSGTASSSQIEARLGLPKSFHKVLTAENVKAVMHGFENNHHFCIIRADLNDDEELAGRFMNWMGSGAAQVISNVTVFQGDRALFDFLISSPLNEVDMIEALTVLDPKEKCLKVELMLSDRKADGQENTKVENTEANVANSTQGTNSTHSSDEESSRVMSMQGAISGDMLESIGELVTGQAMMKHSLSSLFEADLIRLVETDVANAGGQWQAARGAVRQTLEKWLENIEKLMQLESHNSALIDRLQEEAIAERMRPAGLLLKPLAPFIDGQARLHSRQVSLIVVGDEVQLDFSMLESLKATLRALVTFCIIHSIESSEFRIAAGKPGKGQIRVVLVKHDDHISLMVEDDGCGINLERVEQRARQLGWNNEKIDVSLVLRDGFGKVANSEADGVELSIIRNQLRNLGGDLRVNNLPTGGTRFSLTMPLSMVVMEGMVVRVGEVQYVVPIDAIQRIVRAGAAELMRVSAEHGNYKLHMEGDDVLPIQFLRRNGEAASNEGIRLAAMEQVLDGEEDAIKNLFVLVGKGNQRMALSVDELIGQQQVLIRPLLGHLSGIRGVTGCALLGSGDVGMVLDMGYVLNQGKEAID